MYMTVEMYISSCISSVWSLLLLLGVKSIDWAVGQNASAVLQYAPVVRTASGEVVGLVQSTADQCKVHLYQGIRYGIATVRFAKAKPAEPWLGVWNATTWRESCPQRALQPNGTLFGMPLQSSTYSEDCLYLNVWRPAQQRASKRPVMVWLHGGGFESGTIFSLLYDARYIAAKGDVIVVSLNYRLDAFGFLYGGHSAEAPGNIGLHDQILALQWVQQNIHHFGGDPNCVTIFGQSAGAMCVGGLILSPLSKGLFHRAIMQSGAPNSYFGSESLNRSLIKTTWLMQRLNCTLNSFRQNIDCLRNRTVEEILNATHAGFYSRHFGFIPIYGDEVMPLRPVEALRTGKFNRDIDLMFGLTRDEGSTFVNSMFTELSNDTASNMTLESTKWRMVRIMRHYRQPYGFEVARFYTAHLTQSSSVVAMRLATANTFGDYFFVCPTILFGKHMAQMSPQRNYFAYRLMQSSNVSFGDCTAEWMGVCHGQDILYLFVVPSVHFSGMLFGGEDRVISEHMISAWTQFASTGRIEHSFGGHRWTEAFPLSATNGTQTPSLTEHFSFNATNYRMVRRHFDKNCQFWKSKIFI